mgnify:CR=1 FL=1
MKNLFLFLILSVLTGGKNYTQAASSRDAIVYQEKDVRFTMLAEGVVRMEWSPSGQFVDAPSFVVVQRNLPVPEYKVCHKGEWVLIKTAKMEVKYKKHSGKFTSDNLMIKAVNGLKPFCWKPGMQQKDNLKELSGHWTVMMGIIVLIKTRKCRWKTGFWPGMGGH